MGPAASRTNILNEVKDINFFFLFFLSFYSYYSYVAVARPLVARCLPVICLLICPLIRWSFSQTSSCYTHNHWQLDHDLAGRLSVVLSVE